MVDRRLLTLFALALAVVGASNPSLAKGRAEPFRNAADKAAIVPDADAVVARHALLPLHFERAHVSDVRNVFIARMLNGSVVVSAEGVFVTSAAATAMPRTIALRFARGNPHAAILADEAGTVRINRIGHGDARDAADVPAHRRIVVADVYPGIDVAFHGRGRELEFDIIVAPGADPSRFGLRFDIDALVAQDGELVVGAGEAALTLKRPVAYQDVEGERRLVSSAFAIDAEGLARVYVGDYDKTRALVIDPVVSYATYLGGTGNEQGMAIAVDAAGNTYIAGYTSSADFPLKNAYDSSLARKGSDTDVFVSKLNAGGTALVWSTFIGGSAGVDRAVGIAVDASGAVYVSGQTSGTDFPTTSGAWQKAATGGGGFVAKLAPEGNALVYSTYIAAATPSSIAVDASGHAYIAGSATPSFVTTPGALRTVSGSPGGETAFVLKLNASGSAPVYSTFLGGTGGEDATSIAVDANESAYVGGWTTSSDFPIRNAFQSIRAGGKDGFVAKLASDGASLAYATLLGGSLDDAVNAIAVDLDGRAYVAGETYSTDFPAKDGFQMQKAGHFLVNSSVGNAFVAKLEATGNALVYASFLGGEVCTSFCEALFGSSQYQGDVAYAIAVDGAGHAYIGGLARSYTFPLVDSGASRKEMDNQDSAFVAKVAISGRALLWSTFLRTGFGEFDRELTRVPPGALAAIAVDSAGNAYATGDAPADANFVPTPGAFQTVNTGPSAIIAKFAAAPALMLATSNPDADAQTPITLTATLAGPPVAGTVNFMDGAAWIASGVLSGNSASASVTLRVGIHSLGALVSIPGNSADASPLVQVVDVPLTCNQPTASE